MLKPKRKITKQEIKRDPFLEFINDAQQWISDRKKIIYQIAFGVIAVVAVIYFINNSRIGNNKEAESLLGKALLSQDLGDVENARFQLQALVDDFDGTQAGTVGAYHLGKMLYDEAKFEDSADYLLNYAKKGESSELKAASYKLLANIELSNDNANKAENYLENGYKAAEGTVYENELALLYANQIFENGNSTKSLKLVNDVLDQDDILFSVQKIAEELKGKIEG